MEGAAGHPVRALLLQGHVVRKHAHDVRLTLGGEPIGRIVLSGGVFQNAYLLEHAAARLEAQGLTVYSHHKVPPNDGGLALGQAVLAGLEGS